MPEEILQPGQASKDGKIINDTNQPVNLDAGQSIHIPNRRDRKQDNQ